MKDLSPTELSERLRRLLAECEDLAEAMNEKGTPCSCCGLVKRENMDDYQAKQALEACSGRIAKLVEKLHNGQWQGREYVAVTSAESLRSKGG